MPGKLKPRGNFGDGGIGDWEFGDWEIGDWAFGARYSYLDLNDADIRRGRLNDRTLGLNWHLSGYTKSQLNCIRSLWNSPVNGRSTADFVVARAQVDF